MVKDFKFIIGKEYTILNEKQWNNIFNNKNRDINPIGSYLIEENLIKKVFGKKYPATHPYAIFLPKEEGGNGLINFTPQDTLEYFLESDIIEVNTHTIDYVHNEDTYYKRKKIKLTENFKEKLERMIHS